MDFYIGGPGAGKTTALLEWARRAPEGEHRVIVCHSSAEAMRLLRENRRFEGPADLESWQFIGPDGIKPEAWSGVLRGRGGRVVLGIDNLDLILPQILGWPVGVVTAAGTSCRMVGSATLRITCIEPAREDDGSDEIQEAYE